MPTNPYFDHYTAANEQNLIADLVAEAIYTQGIDVSYVERSQDNLEFLYNEDPSSAFESSTKIAMYPLFVDGFDGDELMSMFGHEFNKTGTFVVSKKVFLETFPYLKRPKEGDVIYLPIVNAILEIKHVEDESRFFEKGKQYVWEIKTEAFEFSHEDFTTVDSDVERAIAEIKVPNQDTDAGPHSSNDDLDTDNATNIVFDPANPFGVD